MLVRLDILLWHFFRMADYSTNTRMSNAEIKMAWFQVCCLHNFFEMYSSLYATLHIGYTVHHLLKNLEIGG